MPDVSKEQALIEFIAEWFATNVDHPQDSELEEAEAFVNGPLSNRRFLMQIPLVYELVQEAEQADESSLSTNLKLWTQYLKD